jgi:hypothetical protein
VLLLIVATLVAAPVTWELTASRRGGPGCTARIGKSSYTLDEAQAANASTIAVTAVKLRLPIAAVRIGIATALQESGLHNLTHGDRDSIGIFQQRPSQGWGTRTQILSPSFASTSFFNRLTTVAGWDRMPLTVAAQAVQRSGHPNAYAKWQTEATVLSRALTGEIAGAFTCTVARPRPKPFSELTSTLKIELGGKTLDTSVDPQRAWLIASWVVARSNLYGVTQITATDQRWTASIGGWRPGPRTSVVHVIHR